MIALGLGIPFSLPASAPTPPTRPPGTLFFAAPAYLRAVGALWKDADETERATANGDRVDVIRDPVTGEKQTAGSEGKGMILTDFGGGKWALVSDGVDDGYSPSAGIDLTDAGTIAFCVSQTDTGDSSRIANSGINNGLVSIRRVGNTIYCNGNITDTPLATDANSHTIIFRRASGGNYTCRVDGVPVPINNNSTPFRTVGIGSGSISPETFAGPLWGFMVGSECLEGSPLFTLEATLAAMAPPRPVPAPAAGQTPRKDYAEYFLSDRTSGSPGKFASVSGQALTMARGVTFLDADGNRQTAMAAVRKMTGVEQATGGNAAFIGHAMPLPASMLKKGMVACVVRPGDFQQFVGSRMLVVEEGVSEHVLNKVTFLGNTKISNEMAATGNLVLDDTSLVLLWTCWEVTEGVGTEIRSYAQVSGGSPVLLSTLSSGNPGYSFTQVRFGGTFAANQPPFEGQVGFIVPYEITDLAAGEQAPADLLLGNAGRTVTVESVEDFIGKFNANQLWTRKKNCADGNGYRDQTTLSDATSQSQWGTDYLAEMIVGTGDVVRFPAGEFWIGGTDMLGAPLGITRVWPPTGTTINCSRTLSGSWARPDPGTNPNVWQYDSALNIRQGLWQVTGGGDRLPFIPVFVDDLTAALPEVQAKPFSMYTDSSGNTIIHRPDGVDPNTQTIQANDPGAVTFEMAGGFCQGNVRFIGMAAYNYQQTVASNRCWQNCPVASPYATVTVVSFTAEELSKHGFVRVSSPAVIDLCLRIDCTYDKFPPYLSGGSDQYGVNTASDCTADVDFANGNPSALSPGLGGFTYVRPVMGGIAVEGQAAAGTPPVTLSGLFCHSLSTDDRKQYTLARYVDVGAEFFGGTVPTPPLDYAVDARFA